ncbi:MAG TPA: DUF72 domain-containing protein [Planctomycetota bacterium]|nr:DUF72 domain-containing protein [Planctomycetota bacterium]
MSSFLYGTSSWSEKSWAGGFYPAGLAAGGQLAHYATQFNTVEADVTYYRVPDAKLVSGWQAKTPESFVLSAKFPQSIVHGGKESTPDPERLLVYDQVAGDLERFLASMALLGDKCGPLVLQFPYFNQRAFKSVEPFLERLDQFLARLPARFRYGVEIRNKHWIAEPLLEVLRRHRTALVLVDIGYMPHPADLAKQLDLFTTDFTYARLIGDRKAIDLLTDRFDKVVVDQAPRLAKWAELLREASNRLPRIFAYANNHYAGYAPETIRDLAARMEG